jgi:hypothetical protein
MANGCLMRSILRARHVESSPAAAPADMGGRTISTMTLVNVARERRLVAARIRAIAHEDLLARAILLKQALVEIESICLQLIIIRRLQSFLNAAFSSIMIAAGRARLCVSFEHQCLLLTASLQRDFAMRFESMKLDFNVRMQEIAFAHCIIQRSVLRWWILRAGRNDRRALHLRSLSKWRQETLAAVVSTAWKAARSRYVARERRRIAVNEAIARQALLSESRRAKVTAVFDQVTAAKELSAASFINVLAIQRMRLCVDEETCLRAEEQVQEHKKRLSTLAMAGFEVCIRRSSELLRDASVQGVELSEQRSRECIELEQDVVQTRIGSIRRYISAGTMRKWWVAQSLRIKTNATLVAQRVLRGRAARKTMSLVRCVESERTLRTQTTEASLLQLHVAVRVETAQIHLHELSRIVADHEVRLSQTSLTFALRTAFCNAFAEMSSQLMVEMISQTKMDFVDSLERAAMRTVGRFVKGTKIRMALGERHALMQAELASRRKIHESYSEFQRLSCSTVAIDITAWKLCHFEVQRQEMIERFQLSRGNTPLSAATVIASAGKGAIARRHTWRHCSLRRSERASRQRIVCREFTEREDAARAKIVDECDVTGAALRVTFFRRGRDIEANLLGGLMAAENAARLEFNSGYDRFVWIAQLELSAVNRLVATALSAASPVRYQRREEYQSVSTEEVIAIEDISRRALRKQETFSRAELSLLCQHQRAATQLLMDRPVDSTYANILLHKEIIDMMMLELLDDDGDHTGSLRETLPCQPIPEAVGTDDDDDDDDDDESQDSVEYDATSLRWV